MEITEQQVKNHKRFHWGKFFAELGAGILAFLYLKKTLGNTIQTADGETVFVIDDSNADTFIAEHEKPNYYGHILYVPKGHTNIMIQTSKRYTLHNIMPEEGDFADGTRIRIFGNAILRPNTGENEEYQLSQHIYTDVQNNNGRNFLEVEDCNGCELLCFKKQWWFII